MKEKSANFEALMQRVCQGSDEAMWQLLEKYSTRILRAVRARLPTEMRINVESLDIVQSVWRSVLRKDSSLNSIDSAEQFVAYLAGIARLKILETHRRYTSPTRDVRRVQSLEHVNNAGFPHDNRTHPLIDRRSPSPSSMAALRESWDNTIGVCGDRGEQIIRLRLRGLTHEEIAAKLSISVPTVRRALKSMMNCWDQ